MMPRRRGSRARENEERRGKRRKRRKDMVFDSDGIVVDVW